MNKYNLLQSLGLLLGSVKETLLGSSLAELVLWWETVMVNDLAI